jgi:hypothetical protein
MDANERHKHYEALVAKALEEMQAGGGFVSFDGDEFCEGCRGWDGMSRRCDCGNRRVEWVTFDDDSGVYAEAY